MGIRSLKLLGAAVFAALPTVAFAQDMTADKGDTAWMLTSTVLVMLMILPGLALFYGGLVRTKNMLSLLSQVLGIAAVTIIGWVIYGYSMAFSGSGSYFGDLAKAGLAGIKPDTLAATYTAGVGIPEYVFVAFQMTFAAITVALVVGSLAERVKFAAIMLFAVLWLALVYAPIAHMVWFSEGLLFKLGALDFAGGTVVHINSGIAGLVGVFFAGRRIGFLRDAMPPHSLALTLTGAGLLWVGWFGFNAGSALEANGTATLAMINTFIAPAAGVITWMVLEWIVSKKPSMLGGASGAVAGLVGITPAAGMSGPMGAILLGVLPALVCYVFVGHLKNKLKLDDSLDAFGIHGLGGIVGSLGTAIVMSPAFGGTGAEDYSIGGQLGIQAAAVAVAILWSAIGSAICYAIVKALVGLRHPEDQEREGLDISDHGERAYNY
jgi:ammonium transporter, Amt family